MVSSSHLKLFRKGTIRCVLLVLILLTTTISLSSIVSFDSSAELTCGSSSPTRPIVTYSYTPDGAHWGDVHQLHAHGLQHRTDQCDDHQRLDGRRDL